MNIFSTAPITYAQAALGGKIRISTVDGEVEYEVKPGNTDRYQDPSAWKRCTVTEKQKCSR